MLAPPQIEEAIRSYSRPAGGGDDLPPPWDQDLQDPAAAGFGFGGCGRYGDGDLQWMSAGRGVQHQELFPLVHTDRPNTLHFYQLWLNLPAADKLCEPQYNMIWAETVPVVEGAGGWMVPYATNPMVWQSDVVRALELPVVVVARTSLGTLNHTLSTLRAIRADSVRVAGLILVGESHPENEADLAIMGETTVLARLPRLDETGAQFATLVETIRAYR